MIRDDDVDDAGGSHRPATVLAAEAPKQLVMLQQTTSHTFLIQKTEKQICIHEIFSLCASFSVQEEFF